MTMDLYTKTSYSLAKKLTENFSTSFSASSTLFSSSLRPHIYAIYGLVRIADEIVDTYRGGDMKQQLDALEEGTYVAISRHYSSNPIVHAFATTARMYNIDKELIAPFFESMRTDITPPKKYNQFEYERYIYGSAEVVGLMCLKVFCGGDAKHYGALKSGAQALGAAYQKVNFLRDIGEDSRSLGRVYFPSLDSIKDFNDTSKIAIENDIMADLKHARTALLKLPKSSRYAVSLSYEYYSRLLVIIKRTPAETLKHGRVRVPDYQKIFLLIKTKLRSYLV